MTVCKQFFGASSGMRFSRTCNSNQCLLALVILVVFRCGEAIGTTAKQFDVDLHDTSLLGVPFTKCTGTGNYAVTVEGTSDPVDISGLEMASPMTMTLRSSNSTTVKVSLSCVSHSDHIMGTAVLSVKIDEESVSSRSNKSFTDGTTKGTTSEESSSSSASTVVATNAEVIDGNTKTISETESEAAVVSSSCQDTTIAESESGNSKKTHSSKSSSSTSSKKSVRTKKDMSTQDLT